MLYIHDIQNYTPKKSNLKILRFQKGCFQETDRRQAGRVMEKSSTHSHKHTHMYMYICTHSDCMYDYTISCVEIRKACSDHLILICSGQMSISGDLRKSNTHVAVIDLVIKIVSGQLTKVAVTTFVIARIICLSHGLSLGVFLDTQTLKKHPSGHPDFFVRDFLKCHSQTYNWIFSSQYYSHDIL